MTWDRASRRRGELPPDWSIIQRDVLTRDGHRCQVRGPRCVGHAIEVNHKGNRFDHGRANLEAACTPCHRGITARQGNDANRQKLASAKHPAEKHPGFA